MGILATILSIILALLRVAPGTLRAVQDRQQRERESTAAKRLQEKDDRVDDAIRRAQDDHESSDAPKS